MTIKFFFIFLLLLFIVISYLPNLFIFYLIYFMLII